MDLRNNELLANNTSWRDIAKASASEQMISIANKSKADSQKITVCTLIAVIYLPISLVTVSVPPLDTSR